MKARQDRQAPYDAVSSAGVVRRVRQVRQVRLVRAVATIGVLGAAGCLVWLLASPWTRAAGYEPRLSVHQQTMTTRPGGLTAAGVLVNDEDRPLMISAGDPRVAGTALLAVRLEGQASVVVVAPHGQVPVTIALRVTDCARVPTGRLTLDVRAGTTSANAVPVALRWPGPPPGWCATGS